MREFKRGQRVYWYDPEGVSSGIYTVMNVPVTEKDLPEEDDERIILIGDGHSEVEAYPAELDIVCPLTPDEIKELRSEADAISDSLSKLLGRLTEAVSRYEGGGFDITGHTYRVMDEDNEPCEVYGLEVRKGVLYARVGYEEGVKSTIPITKLSSAWVTEITGLIYKSACL